MDTNIIIMIVLAVVAACAGFAAAWLIRGAKLLPEIELARARQADAERGLSEQRANFADLQN
nr:hypothetical protein [bacterium]